MCRVAFVISAHDEPQPSVLPGIDAATEGIEIQGHLDEATLVVEPNVAEEMQAGSPKMPVEAQLRARDSTHHAIADRAPRGLQSRDQIIPAHVVNKHLYPSHVSPDTMCVRLARACAAFGSAINQAAPILRSWDVLSNGLHRVFRSTSMVSSVLLGNGVHLTIEWCDNLGAGTRVLPVHPTSVVLAISLFALAPNADAVLYSYTNADGEYVVSQKRPENKNTEYAVLSDDGEFIRMVPGRDQRMPVTHWRPWFIPKEPHPWDAAPHDSSDREPVVTVEEDVSQ